MVEYIEKKIRIVRKRHIERRKISLLKDEIRKQFEVKVIEMVLWQISKFMVTF